MTRRDISLTLALCASLAVHALLLAGAAEWYAQVTGSHIRLPGFARSAEATSILVAPLPDEHDPMDRLGDSSGQGKSIADAPGDHPQEAVKADHDQPLLSLDPDGASKIGVDPTDSTMPLGQSGAIAAAIQQPVESEKPSQPAEQQIAIGVGKPADELANPFVEKPQPEPTQPQQPETPKTEIAQAPAAVEASMLAKPGAEASADAAPQGTSESDPFSTIGSAQFKRGSTEVRVGRKYKLARPRLSLSAQSELMSARTASVVLKIKIDETGNVTSVDVYRSSGSTYIDQPCQLAAYNWWFEPLKDKSGKPIKDVILFGIQFI